MKVDIKSMPLIGLVPITVIGTTDSNSVNFTTIGDISVAGINPPLVTISVNKNHLAYKNLCINPILSINSATTEMMKEVDFAGIYSGHNIDKSKLFAYELSDGVPSICKSPITLIAKVREKVIIDNRVILVCDVIKTLADDTLLEDDDINLELFNPLLYGLDNHYYEAGKKIGTGYAEGRSLEK